MRLISLLVLLAIGCTTKTEYGPCIGAFDAKEPGLMYETDLGNVAGAAVFSETVVVPALVVLLWLKCPVAKR